MNIRKLEDLSKDELIELIKHERETCGQLNPIRVRDRLPERCEAQTSGKKHYWSEPVLIYHMGGVDIAVYDYVNNEFVKHQRPISWVSHWLPIPRLPI